MKLWYYADGYNTLLIDTDNVIVAQENDNSYQEIKTREELDTRVRAASQAGQKVNIRVSAGEGNPTGRKARNKWTIVEDFVANSLRTFLQVRDVELSSDWKDKE